MPATVEQACIDYVNEHLADAVFGETSEDGSGRQKAPDDKEVVLEPLPCDNFAAISECFAEKNYWTNSMEQSLAVLLATNISVKLGGELLWYYLVGPSSAGKSLLCDAIGAAKTYSKSLGKITGIHSGYKIGKSKKDHSVLRMVNHKCAIWKDWTSVLTLPDTMLENIYGELREIYDGSTNTAYRTEIKRDYSNIRFSIIAGTTYEILRHSRSHLGERFLSVDISDSSHGSHKHVTTGLKHIVGGIQNSYPQGQDREVPPDRMVEVKRRTIGFLNHLHTKLLTCKPVHVSEKMLNRLSDSARFIARLRGRVVREGANREIAYRPRPEVAIRLAGQLAKTSMCLATVLNREEVDDKVFEIVTKVGIDTAQGQNFDIISTLMRCHEENEFVGLDAKQIASRIGYMSSSSVTSKLDDMKHLKLVERCEVPNKHGVRGRHNHIWQVLPTARKLYTGLIGV